MRPKGPKRSLNWRFHQHAISLVAALLLAAMVLSGMHGAIVALSDARSTSDPDPPLTQTPTTRSAGPQPRQRSWADDFYNDDRVSLWDRTVLITGGGDHKVILENMSGVPDYYSSGRIISEIINGAGSTYFDYWEKILIHKVEPAGTSITVTILHGGTGDPIPGYEDLDLTDINISGIRMEGNETLRLRGDFNTSLPSSTPILDKWEVWWKPNSPPLTLTAELSSTVAYRGAPIWVYANASDAEDLESELFPIFEWSPDGSQWFTTYFDQGSREFISDYWRVRFEPPLDATLGLYSIRVTFQDLKDDLSAQPFVLVDGLEVKNYPPSAPVVRITPSKPTTSDDLVCDMTSPSTDMDLGNGQITYSYAWLRNNILQKKVTGNTVPSNLTKRGETWRCVVTPFDGIDPGLDSIVETTVLNTPPEVLKPILDFNIEEDSPDTTKLNTDHYFYDADGEGLVFKTIGSVHTHFDFLNDGVVNITSDADWHGRETVTITADDGNASASSTFNITVAAINDPPSLQVEGRHTGMQNKWLNLTCISSDVDDSNFIFSTNISRFKSNFLIDQYSGDISFRPNNDDVGIFEFTVFVTDAHNGVTSVAISLQISDVNDPPYNPSISIPQEGRKFVEGALIDFRGSGSDPDTDSHLTYRWFSSRDGALGEGIERKSVHLTTGHHIITLEVSDGEFSRLTRINITVGEFEEEGSEEKSYLLQWALIIAGLGIFLLLFFGGVLFKNRPPFSKIFRVDSMDPHPSQPYAPPGKVAQSPLPTGLPQAKSNLAIIQSTSALQAPAKPGLPLKTASGLPIATVGCAPGAAPRSGSLPSSSALRLPPGEKIEPDTSDFMVTATEKKTVRETAAKAKGPAFGSSLDDIFDLPGKKGKKEEEDMVACHECGAVIPVTSTKRPLVVKCPECGTEGELT